MKSPGCQRLNLSEEDTPQDVGEWKRLVREDQQKQYDLYVAQQAPEQNQESNEERRVSERLTVLRNKDKPVTQHVSQQSNGKKSRAKWFRDYRDRTRNCPHCGKTIRTKRPR